MVTYHPKSRVQVQRKRLQQLPRTRLLRRIRSMISETNSKMRSQIFQLRNVIAVRQLVKLRRRKQKSKHLRTNLLVLRKI